MKCYRVALRGTWSIRSKIPNISFWAILINFLEFGIIDSTSGRPVERINSSQSLEKLSGVVERITFHNEQNGWSVLKLAPFREPNRLVTVIVHQVQVFAGSTMEFYGEYNYHSKYGEQFKAIRCLERKPASSAALEKYLGSGLIFGVGPATAKKIVSHFGPRTLEVFEESIHDLMKVPGIASKKLQNIRSSWDEHKAIREVMIFLQGYGLSTLLATKIYKTYGDLAIKRVSENPYCLAEDIYGIGFFSADRIALNMNFDFDGVERISAGIRQVLSASRDQGHCFLTKSQILENTLQLLGDSLNPTKIEDCLRELELEQKIKVRRRVIDDSLEKGTEDCYYSKSLFFDENRLANKVIELLNQSPSVDPQRILSWVDRYCEREGISLSPEQNEAVCGIPALSFSILTGGPGCGKTTCTRVLVQLLLAMKFNVKLAAPTGRAAQRMTEVIGIEAKTIHRLLEWSPQEGGFKYNSESPLETDFLIVDEVSMLDVTLGSQLLDAVHVSTQVLFIGDPDQLPAVGAGNVLFDLLDSSKISRFRLTQVFRQAKESLIIKYAHQINRGVVPKIDSPIHRPEAPKLGVDCLFVDTNEATQDQLKFIRKVHSAMERVSQQSSSSALAIKKQWQGDEGSEGLADEPSRSSSDDKEILEDSRPGPFVIPEKYRHVNIEELIEAESESEKLAQVLKYIHPWSTLKFGYSAVNITQRLVAHSIESWMGKSCEVQVLSPQVRGSLGTMNLNDVLQNKLNPQALDKAELLFGGKTLREGDRVIQTRNNYDLGVFNGDIGKISNVYPGKMTLEVEFSSGDQIKKVNYPKEDLSELKLAYAITIHKSQGSEFEVVIIPVLSQHWNMLFRNLIYTGLTRAKKLAIFVGDRLAFKRAIGQIDNRKRQSALKSLIDTKREFL